MSKFPECSRMFQTRIRAIDHTWHNYFGKYFGYGEKNIRKFPECSRMFQSGKTGKWPENFLDPRKMLPGDVPPHYAPPILPGREQASNQATKQPSKQPKNVLRMFWKSGQRLGLGMISTIGELSSWNVPTAEIRAFEDWNFAVFGYF